MSAHRKLTTQAAALWKKNRKAVRRPKNELADAILDLAVIGLAGAAIQKIPMLHAEALASAFSLAFTDEKSNSPESEIIDAEYVVIPSNKEKKK